MNRIYNTLLLLCTTAALPVLSHAAQKPNILFILADDLGYGDVACYNPESKIPTPHLDKFASQGMLFTDAYAGATVCAKSPRT